MSHSRVQQNEKKTSLIRAKGRPKIDPETCKGCELCLEACPERVLRLSSLTNSQGVHFAEYDPEGACTACKSCAIICPDNAIEIYRYESEE